MNRKGFRSAICIMLILCMASAAFTLAAAESPRWNSKEIAKPDKIWKIAMSNNFIGNDWRQNMEAVAKMVASDPYYSSQCTLDIFNCDNDPESQTASIDAIVEMGYDAIIVDSSSVTGIDNALYRAEKAGLVVVVFDQVVATDHFVKIETDWDLVARLCAEFIAEACNYKGNYVLDIGLNGSATGAIMVDAVEKWMKENAPDMVQVATFEGQFAEAPAEEGIASAMAANPQIDAVFSQGYINSIARQFRNAGRKVPVITGGGANGTGIDVLKNKDYDVLQWLVNWSGMGAVAMEYALQMLNGQVPEEKHILMGGVWLSNRPDICNKIGGDIANPYSHEEGVTVYSDYPAAYENWVLPNDFPVQINMDELLEKQKQFN